MHWIAFRFCKNCFFADPFVYDILFALWRCCHKKYVSLVVDNVQWWDSTMLTMDQEISMWILVLPQVLARMDRHYHYGFYPQDDVMFYQRSIEVYWSHTGPCINHQGNSLFRSVPWDHSFAVFIECMLHGFTGIHWWSGWLTGPKNLITS